MSPMLRVCVRKMVYLLSCLVLLGGVASVRANPKPLSKEEQAKIDQAIDRAVAYLKREQTKEGQWPGLYARSHPVAQCALPAYALLEAEVPPNDLVIQKAADFLRRRVSKSDWTYELSLAILFFDRLGDPKDKKLIRSLALRLIAGQFRTGGWTYHVPTVSASSEAILLKSLEELSKQMKEGKSAGEVLRELEVPRVLKHLTIFQDPEKLTWVDRQGNRILIRLATEEYVEEVSLVPASD
jgi:hypothetical protein